MAAVLMPIRGERSAPTFDQKRPNDLGRFFKALEILFGRSHVVDDAEKKEHAVSYVSSDVAETWEAIPEFANPAKTYIDFRDRLFDLYNQATVRYILQDLDRLIGERQRLGMRSLRDLSEFHLSFNAISAFLLAKNLLSAREQSQCYIRVFEDSLQNQIIWRMNILHPHHPPAQQFDIEQIYDAAKWVLQAVPGVGTSYTVAAGPNAQAQAQETGFVKQEQLSAFLKDLTKTLADSLGPANRQRPSATNPLTPHTPQARSNKCMFDGCDRFIRDCAAVEDYIRQGKCRRNFEGKVVLSTGAFVPRDIPGETLRDKVEEWHRRNPNQLAGAALTSNTTLFNAVVDKSPAAIPTIQEVDEYPQFQLSAQDRIAALEAELFNLRVRHEPEFVPIIKTRKQRAEEKEKGKEREVTPDRRTPEPVAVHRTEPPPRRTVTPEVAIPAVQSTSRQSVPPTRVPVPAMPEHPYRSAKDAIYTPPQERNVAAVPKPYVAAQKRPDAAYRTLPAIHDSNIAATVYNRALDTPLTITYHELLSLSPEVRSQVRDAVSSKRVTAKETAPQPVTQATMLQDESMSPEELAYLFPDEEVIPYYADPSTGYIAALAKQAIPDEAIVVDDPYDRYYRTLREGEEPDLSRLIVAKESLALRSIMPLVDNQLKVEAILDPGCQIIAMSEDVCHELGLAYDPTIVLHMQSANGSVDPSLGLARNVAFLVGTLTFYMQVHVIRNPAYDILLGRPFDVITESVVRNFRNEDQTITVHDPNTKRVATIPTIARGPPRIIKKNQVFRK
jgi:hypothetical protein